MLKWLVTLPRRFWDRYKYLVIERPCERCGGYGAGLVIDVVPAGKKIDGKRRMVTKTFTVRSCAWLCRKCRNETKVPKTA